MNSSSNESRRVESDESDDDYHAIIVRLNDRWRVVAALDHAQKPGWILQRQRGAHRSANDWRTRTSCKTRYALMRCVGLYAGDPAALAILAALPLHIDWGAANAATVADSGVRRGARRRRKSPEEVLAR